MNLHDIGIKYGTDKAVHHKFMDFYESHINHLRDEPIEILEIGFFKGASIKTWLEYFSKATINCIDIIENNFNHERFIYKKISQESNKLTEIFLNEYFNLIVDDGSHMTSHQNKSLELLWPKLKYGGFYILEDLHTSFISEYIDSEVTPYEFLKNNISIKEIDNIRNEFEYIHFFQRLENINTDSMTCIIKKGV